MALLDTELESHILKVSKESRIARLHETVSTAQALLKQAANTAPSSVNLSPVSSNQGPGAPQIGDSFSAGDRVRLLPEQESTPWLGKWRWGPHDESLVRISEAGMRVEALGKSSFTCFLGSEEFKTGNHRWEIQIQKSRRMWIGIAVTQTEQCDFTSRPSNFGAPLIAFENDGCTELNMAGTLEPPLIKNGVFRSGQIITIEASVEQHLLKMSVDGKLARRIRGVDLRGARPLVCMDKEGIISLGAVHTSDKGMARSGGLMQASLDCLGQAEEGREGFVLDVRKVKIGFSHQTLVKVGSIGNGVKALFLREALMMGDCLSTKQVIHPIPI